MKDLIWLLRNLIDCSEFQKLEANNGLNSLHICLPEELYQAFITDPAAQQYPQWAAGPGAGPLYILEQVAAVWANKKLAWEQLKKIFKEEKNMDVALLNRFLQLVLTNYKEDFKLVKNRNLNILFIKCYQLFLTTHARAEKSDQAENKASIVF